MSAGLDCPTVAGVDRLDRVRRADDLVNLDVVIEERHRTRPSCCATARRLPETGPSAVSSTFFVSWFNSLPWPTRPMPCSLPAPQVARPTAADRRSIRSQDRTSPPTRPHDRSDQSCHWSFPLGPTKTRATVILTNPPSAAPLAVGFVSTLLFFVAPEQPTVLRTDGRHTSRCGVRTVRITIKQRLSGLSGDQLHFGEVDFTRNLRTSVPTVSKSPNGSGTVEQGERDGAEPEAVRQPDCETSSRYATSKATSLASLCDAHR